MPERPVPTSRPRPSPARIVHPSRNQAVPAPNSAAIPSAILDAENAKLLRSRRYKLGAVAFVIVAVASSLFGAQIKTSMQEYRWRERVKKEAAEASLKVTDSLSKEPTDGTSMLLTAGTPIDKAAPPTMLDNRIQSDQEIARQVAFLEDRRALLIRQRGQILGKFERLRERQARQTGVEERRAGSGIDR